MSGVVVDPPRDVEPATDVDRARLALGVVLLVPLLAAARPTGG
jgi:hypothetical protein